MGDAIFNDGSPFDERRPVLYRSRELLRRAMAAQLLDGPIVAGPLSWSSISVSLTHGVESSRPFTPSRRTTLRFLTRPPESVNLQRMALRFDRAVFEYRRS